MLDVIKIISFQFEYKNKSEIYKLIKYNHSIAERFILEGKIYIFGWTIFPSLDEFSQ